jgi:hypothetical protein
LKNLKGLGFFCLTPPVPTAFYSRNFSLLSFLRKFFSLFFSLLSLFSALSSSLCSLHLTTAHKTATPRPRLEGDPTPLATPRRRDHPSLPRWLAVEIPAGLGSPTAKPAAVACRGDPCRSGGHPRPSLLRWLAVEIPAGLGVTHGQACCGGLPWRSLPVWGSPTAKPAAVACRGDPCRSGGHPRPSLLRWLAVEIPAGLRVTHGQACRGGLPCPIPAGLEVTHGQACRLGC